MKVCNVFILSLLLLFSCTNNVLADFSIDRVSYFIRGDLNELDSLQLKIEDSIDNINSLGLLMIHDGNSLKVEGDWKIEFLKRSTYKMNLSFIFPLDLSNMDYGKGMGFSSETFFGSINRFSLSFNYFFSPKDKWVYEGSFIHPLYEGISLIVGVGNTYWDESNKLFFGFEVGL